MLLLTFLRLTAVVIIFKYPLLGGILALVVDFFDLNLLYILAPNSLENYQIWDKLLDLTYLSTEAYIALSWKNKLVSRIALVLFIYRLIGIITFEIFQQKPILVMFPNVFEPFYLIYLLHLYIFKKDFFKSLKLIGSIVFMITILKLGHEYLLHINTTHPWSENKYIQKIIDPDFIPEIKKINIKP